MNDTVVCYQSSVLGGIWLILSDFLQNCAFHLKARRLFPPSVSFLYHLLFLSFCKFCSFAMLKKKGEADDSTILNPGLIDNILYVRGRLSVFQRVTSTCPHFIEAWGGILSETFIRALIPSLRLMSL